MINSIYISAISQGLLWGIMAMGLYISFRILRVTDLTTESSFTLGAATAVMLGGSDLHPLLYMICVFGVGMLAGLVTGILSTYFEIPSLLASIITMTALYSINLRIMQSPNVSFRGVRTIYDLLNPFTENPTIQRIIIGLIFILLIVLFLSYLFRTDFGQAIIVTGDNPIMADSIGINTNGMIRFALMLANGLIATGGALVAQDTGFSNVDMGIGTVVSALAAIVIGEILFYKELTLVMRFLSIVIGAIIYRIILVFALRLGFSPNDFKLVSATVLAIFLASPVLKQKLTRRLNHGK